MACINYICKYCTNIDECEIKDGYCDNCQELEISCENCRNQCKDGEIDDNDRYLY